MQFNGCVVVNDYCNRLIHTSELTQGIEKLCLLGHQENRTNRSYIDLIYGVIDGRIIYFMIGYESLLSLFHTLIVAMWNK